MEANILLPGAVEVDLGEFRLIPGPKGDPGERGPRGYGIQSAVLNPDFTLTLKFEDGTSYTTPSIRGQAAAEVEDVRLEQGEYQGGYTDLFVVEMSDGRRFEFEIYNKAAKYYDKAEAAKVAAETAESHAENAQNAAESARDQAKASQTASKDSENAAGESAREAGESAQAAKEARTGAETARQGAESARDLAEGCRDRAGESAEKAVQYSGKPPKIQGGNWWVWNAEAQTYVDTGEPVRGNLMYAVFRVDERTGDLYMITDGEYAGPGFRLEGNDLEVVLHG